MVFSEMGRALAGAPATVTMATAVNVTAHVRIVHLLMIFLHPCQRPSLVCGHIWLNTLMAAVNRFTGGNQIRHLVMAITRRWLWDVALYAVKLASISSRRRRIRESLQASSHGKTPSNRSACRWLVSRLGLLKPPNGLLGLKDRLCS